MSEPVYKCSISMYMYAYLHQHKSLGYICKDIENTFMTIDRYLCKNNFQGTFINESVYEKWSKSIAHQKPTTIYQKKSIFIRLLQFMSVIGVACYVPILPRVKGRESIPYTFSEEEMSRIFNACDTLRMKERHTECIMISIPAIIRLLYSTAIRISEALNITMDNINLQSHVIKLVKTKNGCERLAPINKSMEMVLLQYISYRNRLPYEHLKDPDSYLFVSSQGKKISRHTALNYMHKVLDAAGIQRGNDEDGPHLHSIRHTACIHSMLQLARNGMDLYCYLPVLSTFMGHRKVYDTERYLRMTTEMYPELIKQDTSVTNSITSTVKRAIAIYEEENK